jgi:pimeloyl-ACP methyl ester carboxylesterase
MPVIGSNGNDDKLQIYYEIFGKDNSETVVLIHPIGSNIEIWRDEISLILEKNVRIIAYELRGHNRSNMGTKNHLLNLGTDSRANSENQEQRQTEI